MGPAFGLSADYKQVEKLWFEDATVVFQAERHIFRLHRGILALQSSVFRDMFAVPQPPSSNGELIDGCVVIHLPDNADDLCHFFMAIYDASYFETPPRVYPINVVLGIAGLSHKYDVAFLRRRALSHLEVRIPSALADIDRLEVSDLDFEINMAIIRTLSTINAPWLLPVAYLLACDYSPEAYEESGAWAAAENIPYLQRVFVGTAKLRLANHEYFRFLRLLPDPRCVSIQYCLRAGKVWSDLISTLPTGPIGPLVLSSSTFEAYAVCKHCKAQASTVFSSSYTTYWHRLPYMFGLGSWEELNKEKEIQHGVSQ